MSFINAADIEQCRQLHKKYGTTYYQATRWFPEPYRSRVHAIYGFVRVPDEWVDNPGALGLDEQRRMLEEYRRAMLGGYHGRRPDRPELRAFCQVAMDCGIPPAIPESFLEAMRMDLEVRRYERYEDLRRYMDGSACAVGEMMALAIGISIESELIPKARALGEAMQMTNFLRDVGEDARRGRIYLPLEDLDRHSVSEDDVMEGRWSDRFDRLMQFEIERTRDLYRQADPGIRDLPPFARRPVLLARILYCRILDRLEAQGRNPFVSRARTTRSEKLLGAAQVMLAEPLVLRKLARKRPQP